MAEMRSAQAMYQNSNELTIAGVRSAKAMYTQKLEPECEARRRNKFDFFTKCKKKTEAGVRSAKAEYTNYFKKFLCVLKIFDKTFYFFSLVNKQKIINY